MLDRSPPKQLAKSDEGDAPDARRSFSDWLADEGLVMRQAFRRFVDQVLRNVSTAQILRWMEEKDLRGFLAYIGESVERLADELPQAFTRTARREIERLNQPGRFGVGKLKVDFDPGNSKAARVIERARLNLIREITRSQRDAIREAIEESLKRGEGAEAAARRFRNMIGLTRNQARAVNTYQSVLERGSADALGRALRDRRFDRTINRIIENDDMLSSKQIERMVQRYAENMRKYRALTIARTEMMRTLNQAKQASWAQMAEQLGMDPDDVVRTWIATLDDRVRDTHEAMHLQTVTGLDTPFESPSGEELLYPGDPMADGAETINCRCTLVVKFPRNKMRMAKVFDPNEPRDEKGRWTAGALNSDKELWGLIGAADRALDGEDGRAVSSWVGGDVDAVSHGAEFGHMSWDALEGRQGAVQQKFQPVADALRAKYGDNIPLYRYERGDAQPAGRSLYSYTSDERFGEHLSGAGKERPLFTEKEIGGAEKEFADTGSVNLSNGITLKQEHDAVDYIGIYDKSVGGFVTDTPSVREYMEDINEGRAEHNAKRKRLLSRVQRERIPIQNIVWATDRFNQKEFIVSQSLSKAYNPDEPRDAHGRWTTGGGDARDARPDLGMSREDLQRHIDRVCKDLNFDKSRIDIREGDHLFELNGQQMKAAGLAYRDTGRIDLFPAYINEQNVDGLLAHEIEHQKFNTALIRYREDSDKVMKDPGPPPNPEAESYPERHGGQHAIMKPNGELRGPYRDKYPAYTAMHDALHRYDTEDFASTDGVSDYSNQWWKGWREGTIPTENAYHETLAEMARIRYETGSFPEHKGHQLLSVRGKDASGEWKPKPTRKTVLHGQRRWRKLFRAVEGLSR